MLFTLLQAGYYAEPASGAAHYSAATMGMFVLIIVIGIAGYAVQARLQSVFRKYSKVQFPGGLTGAEVAEKMLRDNNIHNVKVTHVGGNLTDHFNPQTMTVNLSASSLGRVDPPPPSDTPHRFRRYVLLHQRRDFA